MILCPFCKEEKGEDKFKHKKMIRLLKNVKNVVIL